MTGGEFSSVFMVRPPKSKVFWVRECSSLPGSCWTWHFLQKCRRQLQHSTKARMLWTSVWHRKWTSGSKHTAACCAFHAGEDLTVQRGRGTVKSVHHPSLRNGLGENKTLARKRWLSWTSSEANDLVSTSKCHLEFFFFKWTAVSLSWNLLTRKCSSW